MLTPYLKDKDVNLRERFNRTMHFQSVDRTLNMEFGYWDETIERWWAEGLPQGCKPVSGYGDKDAVADFFGMDMHWRSCFLDINNTGPIPAFDEEVLDEDDETKVVSGKDGVVARVSKKGSSVPQYLKFPVENRRDFEEYKLRLDPDYAGRYSDNWADMVRECKSRDYPLGLNINGFFGQMRNWMGFEKLAYAYYDQPDLIREMCDFWVDFNIRATRRAFEEVELDFVHFWEDMAFNHGPMVSPEIFRRFMAPAYEKVVSFLKSYGIDVIIVDSDGLIKELIPLFLEAGINAILPIEIAAGNDVVSIKKKYGRQLRLLGGIDKRALASGPKAIKSEMKSELRLLVHEGGYIPALDHLVPPDVPLENYRFYLELKSQLLDKARD